MNGKQRRRILDQFIRSYVPPHKRKSQVGGLAKSSVTIYKKSFQSRKRKA